MRSWIPRRPSDRIKARLFAPASAARAAAGITGIETQVGPAAWHWLAPAMAVFCLGMFVAGRTPNVLPGFAGMNASGLVATAAFDDPQLASYSGTAHHSDANYPPVTRFMSPHTPSPAVAPVLRPSTNVSFPVE